ncbi:hypothetical protein BH10PAT1_BH10PAT1_0280 [soil metagenome]
MNKLVVINSYQSRAIAEIDKGLLEANGIEAIISQNDVNGANPLPLSNSISVSLKVKAEDLSKAKELLKLPE